MSTRRIDWAQVDPFLAGPYAGPEGAVAIPFELPRASNGAFQLGRIESGDGWPAGLAALERTAAVPQPAADAPSSSRRGEPVVLYFRARSGARIPICTRAGGAIRWRLDPAGWIRGLLSERYVARWTRPLPSRIPLLNYNRAPHALKGLLEKLQSPRSQGLADPDAFPRLPIDDLADVLRQLCVALAFDAAPRRLALWPESRRAAVTLTHDVDTSWILDAKRRALLRRIVETESSLGFPGAWYVTARQLHATKHAGAIDCITGAGHELAPHGWNHDAKLDYLGAGRQEARIEKALRRFEGLDVAGIRTPWYCRSPQLLRVLARRFAYDSSVPNASAFFSSETNSGCCSLFPYRHADGLLELPMTLPPDTALDPAVRYAVLARLCDRIVEAGGVVVVTLHPQPHQSATERGLRDYFAFLEGLAARHGDRLWRATPREITARYARTVSRGCEGASREPGAGDGSSLSSSPGRPGAPSPAPGRPR